MLRNLRFMFMCGHEGVKERSGGVSVHVYVCVNMPVCVCVNQCGQMRPKQSCTVKGVNGGSAVRGIGMEIKIT